MNKIDWSSGFVGVDGISRSQKWIERWYLRELLIKSKSSPIPYKFTGRIKTWLLNLEKNPKFGIMGRYIVRVIISNLSHILLATPEEQESITHLYSVGMSILKRELDVMYSKTKDKITVKDFNREIYNAFGYDNYRSDLLPILAEYINIKCCPYCNMHYTLLIYRDMDADKKERLAKFQFDHFFDKSDYPLLSMSLYNLIPSCASCNHSKREKHFSLDFHPYHSDLSKKFKFEITGGMAELLFGGNTDMVKVELKAEDTMDAVAIAEYYKDLKLSALYGRHKDIIEEIAAQVYLDDNYYSKASFFDFLKKPDVISSISADVLRRVRFGNYDSPEDIHKRPMAKFRQDIYKALKP